MNECDKQRFARYKKSYVSKDNEFDDDKYKNNNDNKVKLGYIEKIDIKIDELVKKVVKK